MSIKDLNPLITPDAEIYLRKLLQSSSAPKFNHIAGDRIEARDLETLAKFRNDLMRGLVSVYGAPSPEILAKVERWLKTVPLFRDRRRNGTVKEWSSIPTMSREEVARHPELLVPDDQDLDRLIVYRTAGTTGHPLLVPHHPVAAASYQILIEAALSTLNVKPVFESGRCACFLLGAQKSTVTYPTVLSVWNQAGFVKLNLNPTEWRNPGDRVKYLEEFPPEILTGDPISFATFAQLETNYRPKALISTAVAMSASLKASLTEQYGVPVIDWYSLTETGPIGYFKPGDVGYTLLAHDVFVEVLGLDGRAVEEGELGEIVVTGGRNPFVPLLRYRTGDFGRKIGNKLIDLEGRKPVLFKSRLGRPVNPVDIGRVLREFPLVQHHFEQRADLSCSVHVRPFESRRRFDAEQLRSELEQLLEGVRVEVVIDAELGDRIPGGKVMPYVSEARFEE